MTGFDWPALYRVAMRDLGISPDQFWRLTPYELSLLCGGERAVLLRGDLEALMTRFPDYPAPKEG
ncbi:phage tail assembly chaperone [Rhodobacteraceae bacterium XHP0102]|nr:phage tail assembly chaperone [Rhodobacteraceae bacterium XHP0102]